MNYQEAVNIIKSEKNHCATHNRDAGMSEEYHKEMQNLVDAFDIAIKAIKDQRSQGEWIIVENGFACICPKCYHRFNETSNYCSYCGNKNETP